jgi:membrane-associated phospholipid phosphatase
MWALLCLAFSLALGADSEIVKWNKILLQCIVDQAVNPPNATRQLALLHVAQFEAVNSITGDCTSYLQDDSEALIPEAHALPEPAAAQAGYDILSFLYPSADFSTPLDESLSPYNGLALSQSVDLGSAIAQAVLLLRSNDGYATANTGYTAPDPLEDFDWRPTGPGFKPYLLPAWGQLTPWLMTSNDQFASGVPEPPRPEEAQYELELNEVRLLGSLSSGLRTVEQTEIAHTWAAAGGTVTPPGQWFQIAQQLSASHDLNLVQESRLFMLLAIGEADAAITVWFVKRAYTGWRPITAITAFEGSWAPLITTPPFPGYISGHATFSSTAAAIMTLFFASDTQPNFVVVANSYMRQFTSLSAAAEEAAMSRVYGGIHFQADSMAGAAAGQALGAYVYANCAQSAGTAVVLPPPSSEENTTTTSEPTHERHDHEEREEAYLIVILVLACLIFVLVLATLIWLVRPRGPVKPVAGSIGTHAFTSISHKGGRTQAVAHAHEYGGGWNMRDHSWLIAGGFCVFVFVFLFMPIAFWLLFHDHHGHGHWF